MNKIPKHYLRVKEEFPGYISSLENLGSELKAAGPLDEKTSQLIQLAASISCNSEGASHSHVRRALEAGATKAEICHSVIILTSTIGFPRAMAGLSWVYDIIDEK